ncbi:glycosyltransferase [Candidatus Berkelbacteria bacterium]|nr:glycosyltransferase [Candidatus Berkelbacteria bacterium]
MSTPRHRPAVSIVTPCLNAAATLPRLLTCIDSQTYQPIEHVVVDGMSTDRSERILKAANGRQRRIIRRKDRSMYEAINRGLAQTHGEIMAYLNSDDLYFPRTVETVVRYFETHPEVDIVFGDCLSVNTDDDTFVLYLYAPREYELSRIGLDQAIGQPSVFWRRRVWEGLGPFDDSLRFVADFEWWLRASRAGYCFAKLNRILSIDCRAKGVLRNRHAEALATELAMVRGRYYQAIGWQRRFHERRNYWEGILRKKLAEYRAGERFLPEPPGMIWFDQARYRAYHHQKPTHRLPILALNLPYFSFTGNRIEGL